MPSVLRKTLVAALCALLVGLPAPRALAGPSGEVVIEGDADFSRPDDHTTIIDTTTQQTLIQYDSFDILQGELVEINQPTDDSRTINYIPFGDATQIAGRLDSNAYVYIVNPSGVFLGDTAMIDVGGLVAAAGRIAYDDFMAGQDRFTELGGEVVVADGAVVQADDTVALLGQRVANYGTIISEGGMVAFVAGKEAVLGSLDGRMIVRVDGGGDAIPDDAFALTQAGEVDAGGGRVLLTAGDTYSLAMNHTGVTRGREIELHAASDGLVQVAGTLDASGRDAGETGGRIAVSGEKIALLGATLDASGDAGGGSIRVGGDVQGAGSLRNARRTFVSTDSRLLADAGSLGDGGSIVVWSEEKTGFYGSASARGGSQGGDGGFVEISGRQSLDARGHRVDVSAPQGANGTLLYDPSRIEIQGSAGGAADGDDADALADSLDGGMGQILNSDAPGADFVVTESEIEGTNANIVLQATEQIEATGSFIGDDVVVMPGNSLVLQTTGDGPVGEYAIDLLPNVTWRVSGGGIIYISTNAGNVNDPNDTARADIRVGNLVFESRAFDTSDGIARPQNIFADPELGVFGLNTDSGTDGFGVNVVSEVGDIEIGQIVARGADADALDADGAHRFASSGASVLVSAASGDVTLGSVDTRGGNALLASPDGPAPSEGGVGGEVRIESFDGNVTVVDGIDASGGQGLAGNVLSDSGEENIVAGVGGSGGLITLRTLSSSGGPALLEIMGDLRTNGGNGAGEIGIDTGSGTVTLAGSGGTSGRLDLSGAGGVLIHGTAMDPIFLEANGGDGRDNLLLQTTGGGSSGGAALNAISIQVPAGDGTQAGPFDVDIANATIRANGGDAIAGAAGGAGGNGGNVLINAGDDGSVNAWDGVAFEANGGDGGAAGFNGPGARPGFGGRAGALSITGNGADGVTVGDIEALGGSGDGAAGGIGGGVTVTSAVGTVTVANIDVSGGDASFGEPDEAVGGGLGGAVFLDSRTPTAAGDDDTPDPGGDVVVGGRVTSFGGSGFEADGVTPLVSAGGRVVAQSDAAIEGPGSLEGGDVQLEAPTIGGIAAIDIAGTEADFDKAFLATSGSMHVNLLSGHGPAGTAPGSGMEDVKVFHTDGMASTQLDAGGVPSLVVNGAAMPDGDVTLALMQTSDTDPRLAFQIDAFTGGATGTEPAVVVDVGAVDLGSAGGAIINDDGAIVGAAGAGAGEVHAASTGNLLLDATSIGEAGQALRVTGGPGASLQLLAAGDVEMELLDVAGAGAFAALDVRQDVATAGTSVTGLDAVDGFVETILDVAPVANPDPDSTTPTSRMTASTVMSGMDLAYRHEAAETAEGAPALQLSDVRLGGNGIVTATGDLSLVDTDAPSVELVSAGSDLALDTGGELVGADLDPGASHIRMAAGPDDDPASLALLAVGGVGTASGGALVTEDVERLATLFGGDFRLQNGGGAEGLEIGQIQVLDPTDRSGETVQAVVTGVIGGSSAGDDFELDNGANRIVLGRIPVNDPSVPAGHVNVSGDVTFLSPVQVENAQYVLVDEGTPDEALVAVNSARIAAGGDVLFAGALDSGPDLLAVDDITDPMEATPAPTVPVYASLTVDAGGIATYQADVGAVSPFALFDTSRAVLAGQGETREIHAGDIVFRGPLDGPATVWVRGDDTGLAAGEPTRVRFGGNVGAGTALAGLDVQADGIEFAVAGGGSAELVSVGSGGILLDTGQTPGMVPAIATIHDTAGNLRFQTSGEFQVGALDKLSAVGDLQIVAAGPVTVGDLSASRIQVSSPDILVMTRDGAAVELPDGSTTLDAGVDWVANSIRTSSAPQAVGPGSIGMFIGSGGISIPGDLGSYTVRYASPTLDAVSAGLFVGQNGRILDLTGSGPPLVGDPTRSLVRVVPPTLPDPVPGFGSDAPAAAPRVSGRQVLAFVRCGGAPPAPGCGLDDQTALVEVSRLRDSALGSARAQEIRDRYRALLGSPAAAERLRAAFAQAGQAFGQSLEWRDGTLDGAAFYRFLEAARGSEATDEALASLRELAWLYAEIGLLGLDPDETRQVQDALAREFAAAAALQGFDAEAVTAAVDASPVGLP